MAIAKIYNSGTAAWEAAIVGQEGPQGIQGIQGEVGSDGALSPNYIINSAFDFWQRGTTFTNTVASFAYHTDRWFSGANAATTNHVISQQTFSPGAAPLAGNEGQFYLRSAITDKGSATVITMQHKVEDVRTLAGQQVTLSFYARADASRTLDTIQLIQTFGSGGSANVSSSNFTAALTSSWQRFSYTINVASLSGKTIGTNSALMLYMQIPVIDGSTLDLWGVQLEAGSIATPFKRNAPSLQGELAACQRYYFTTSGSTAGISIASGSYYSTTSFFAVIHFPTTMRATPTFTKTNPSGVDVFSSGSNRAATDIALNGAGQNAAAVIFYTTARTAGDGGWAESNSGGSTINFSAEL